MIDNLIQLLKEDDHDKIMQLVDFTALSQFFKQKKMNIPVAWLPHLDKILKQVLLALKKIPILTEFELGKPTVIAWTFTFLFFSLFEFVFIKGDLTLIYYLLHMIKKLSFTNFFHVLSCFWKETVCEHSILFPNPSSPDAEIILTTVFYI